MLLKLIIATLALICVVYKWIDCWIVFKRVCDSFRVGCRWIIHKADSSDSVLNIQRVASL